MLQRVPVFVLFLFVSVTAPAQTSPCLGGTTNPLFTVILPNPVQLKFEHLTTHTLTGALVNVAGNNITVSQTPLDIPPPPGPPGPGPSPSCNSQTVSLGTLLPGTYNVNWIYSVPPALPGGQPTPVETYPFTFSVPASADVPALDPKTLVVLLVVLAIVGVTMLRR